MTFKTERNVMPDMNKVGVMRNPVKQIYDRQVARCLSDIKELYDLPALVEERIKRAIEFTAKDVDKLNQGDRYGDSIGNR